VDLQIEALVLHGFAFVNRRSIGEAIERELTRLFSQHGLPSSLFQAGVLEQLDGGSFQVGPGTKEQVIGIQVAQAVYGVVRQQSSAPASLADSLQPHVDSASPKSR